MEAFEAQFKDPIKASIGDLQKRRATVEKEQQVLEKALERQEKKFQGLGYSI